MRILTCLTSSGWNKIPGGREFVLFDADGPGAVVRWWMTFYKAQNGIIRVYIDNDTIPLLSGTPWSF